MKTKVISVCLTLAATAMMAQPVTYETEANLITSDIEYVPVTHSEPVYSTITKNIPHEVCQDQQVPLQRQSGGNSVVGGIVGGIIGGVLGHQIGGGSGKVAATIGGAAVGTMIGQNAGNDPRTTYQTVRRCVIQYETKSEKVLTGYINYAKYRNQDIAKMSDEPLKEIKVTNSFSF
ncbi:MAG TPA: glycine zipper 2TM domain-containing protein [Sulfuricurvum sp.]|nr:glycine zipper 2TM domain-containing protein [Sulfuricurvum sp.]